ncbi:hypothetical protein CPC08DRAFT_771688 [Agrocybe pediades]|nr:hypothetical protein CPC08DRAFT_771688 [Agrocybe pediades]
MAYATSLIVWLTVPDYVEIPATITNAMNCILGSRMIFNLREAATKQETSSARTAITPLVGLTALLA